MLKKRLKKQKKLKESKPAHVKYDELGDEIVKKTSSSLSSVIKAIIYIVFVLTAGVILAYYIITVGNDVFAFKKAEVSAEITLSNYETVKDLSEKLHDEGIIQYPAIFRLYASLRHDSGEFLAGKYTVDTSMNYDTLLASFKHSTSGRTIVTLTVPEGYTVDDIIELFLSKGMGTRDGFVQAINEADFSKYEFVRRLEDGGTKTGRKYRLEGYLFPDTYEFYEDWDEERILQTFLDNFERKFTSDYYERIDKLDMTVDEYITLASMIQAEAKYSDDMDKISRVFHNRLNHPSDFPYLESDATLQYVMDVRKPNLSYDDLELDSPYNTYKYKGLPPGAICNPGANAILAALQPTEDEDYTGYYYFVSRSNGETLYARTLAEHNKNKELVKNEQYN